MSIQDKDRGYKKFVRNMKRLKKGPNVTVGIQGDEAKQAHGPGQTNAGVMTIHEFGAPAANIPQRSVLRATIDRERKKIDRLLDRAVKATAADGNAQKHLGIVGEFTRAAMIRTMDQSIGLAALKPETIAAKGSSKPLIDTGMLKNALTWEVHVA